MKLESEIITSRTNASIKWIRSLQDAGARRDAGCFIIEGVRLLEEAHQIPLHTLIVCPRRIENTPRARTLAEQLSQQTQTVLQVSEAVLDSLSDTRQSQGLLAVVMLSSLKVANRADGLLLALDGVADPGNMGTILRTARSMAVSRIFVLNNCVDIYNPKVVRSGMGAHFHLNVCDFPGWDHVDSAVQIVAADARATADYRAVDWQKPTLLLIGGEAHGLQARPENRPVLRVKISMAAGVESLNVAVATGILLAESFQAQHKQHEQIVR